MREIRLVVRGKVQGVGFRQFIREVARRHGLTGWVRNQPDGSVEIAARGPEPGLAALRAAAGGGPPGAAVAAINDLPPDGSAADDPFAIRRG